MTGSARPVATRRAAIAVLSLLIAFLVIRQAAISAFAGAIPDAVRQIAPGDPVALIASSRYTDQGLHPPTADQQALLHRAARADPLYADPFLAGATSAAARHDDHRAIALALAARARDPRRLATNTLLVQEYARVGDIRDAVAAMDPIALLSAESTTALGRALTSLAQDPAGARVIAAALRTNPRWRDVFVKTATGSGQALAFQTLVATPPGASRADERDVRKTFLSQLVQRGEYQRAYLAWVNFLPPSEMADVAAIYDGDFKTRPGLEPFNWTLRSDEVAVAERRTDASLPGGNALDVNYFGSDAGVIATETMLVSPGSYRFEMLGNADGGGNFAGRLHWQLVCLPGNTVIPLASVAVSDGRPFRVSAPVVIPAQGCEAQQITLAGDPGDVATLIHAQFTGLKLESP